MQRRLAAILVADVVGYSRLVEKDEGRTLSALSTLQTALLQPQIAAHAGRIVKLMGDGLIAEFASVVEAVSCAVQMQNAIARQHDRPIPPARSSFGSALMLVTSLSMVTICWGMA